MFIVMHIIMYFAYSYLPCLYFSLALVAQHFGVDLGVNVILHMISSMYILKLVDVLTSGVCPFIIFVVVILLCAGPKFITRGGV